jgi:hypothetical protein
VGLNMSQGSRRALTGHPVVVGVEARQIPIGRVVMLEPVLSPAPGPKVGAGQFLLSPGLVRRRRIAGRARRGAPSAVSAAPGESSSPPDACGRVHLGPRSDLADDCRGGAEALREARISAVSLQPGEAAPVR